MKIWIRGKIDKAILNDHSQAITNSINRSILIKKLQEKFTLQISRKVSPKIFESKWKKFNNLKIRKVPLIRRRFNLPMESSPRLKNLK